MQVKKKLFLLAYANEGTILHAAETAKIGRMTHYDWLKSDPEYAAAFRDAEKTAAEGLEKEARRRAFAGSDTLLIFLLKGALPEKYRERVDLSVDVSAEVRRLAAEMGLDEQQVLAEAEAILSGRS